MSRLDPIQRLIQQLGKLPGIGQKTATRLAFHVLRTPTAYVRELSSALIEVKEKIRLCSVCMHVTEENPCALCQDNRRDAHTICVVAHSPDVLAIERTGGFQGRYHVLHGVLSPLDGIGPDQLHIRELTTRFADIQQPIHEVIVATSPNVEGEATAVYLARLIKPFGIKVTRIASGLPMGGEIEYADGITIRRAIEVRREM